MILTDARAVVADAAATSGPNWGLAGFGLLFVAICAMNAINPKLQWQLSKWTRKNPAATEPSEAGLRMNRIVNSVLVVVGIVMIVIGLTR